MNWKEYCEKRAPYDKVIEDANNAISELDKEYIKANEVFKWGDHVVIDTGKAERHAVVVGNTIGENGRIIPTMVLIRRSRKKMFFRAHETNPDIKITKYEDL